MRAISSRPLLAAGALLLAGAITACAEPELTDPAPDGEAIESPEIPEVPDPSSGELLAATEDLVSVLEQARDRLATAAAADDLDAARAAAEEANALLLADPDGASDVTTLFPSTTSEERGGSGEASDALTLTLSAAQDAGGTVGRRVIDALRDPLAGDLGVWQRDPAGLVAQVRHEVEQAGDLASAEQTVLAIPGEGTRALAWTLLAVDGDDLGAVRAYAERGATHLDFALQAVRDALGVVGDHASADTAAPDRADNDEDGG